MWQAIIWTNDGKFTDAYMMNALLIYYWFEHWLMLSIKSVYLNQCRTVINKNKFIGHGAIINLFFRKMELN